MVKGVYLSNTALIINYKMTNYLITDYLFLWDLLQNALVITNNHPLLSDVAFNAKNFFTLELPNYCPQEHSKILDMLNQCHNFNNINQSSYDPLPKTKLVENGSFTSLAFEIARRSGNVI